MNRVLRRDKLIIGCNESCGKQCFICGEKEKRVTTCGLTETSQHALTLDVRTSTAKHSIRAISRGPWKRFNLCVSIRTLSPIAIGDEVARNEINNSSLWWNVICCVFLFLSISFQQSKARRKHIKIFNLSPAINVCTICFTTNFIHVSIEKLFLGLRKWEENTNERLRDSQSPFTGRA